MSWKKSLLCAQGEVGRELQVVLDVWEEWKGEVFIRRRSGQHLRKINRGDRASSSHQITIACEVEQAEEGLKGEGAREGEANGRNKPPKEG